MQYLESLNSEQKKAVLATEGPVLIVAGAGAGKTKTLTHRILHLIHQGTHPQNILAITFTNKAAREMRERVHNLLPNTKSLPFVSTFHALGVQIIRENAALLKLKRQFNIFDKTDSKKVLKEILIKLGFDPKEHLEKVQHVISREKGNGTTFHEYTEKSFHDYHGDLIQNAWRLYEETLNREHALDFDDLLLKSLKLLQTYPDILEIYQNRFRYIHVDEYQDTNKVQNELITLLARKHKNICVVGDTDQNIYSWRGAEIKHMLHFERYYPGAQTIFLEENYRSTKNIISVANQIIEKNTYRIPKKLFTQNSEGEKISLFEGRNETDEAHFIALRCKELIANGIYPEEIAILYRANFQSRVLEEAMLAYGVPYQMLGTKFFERKEVKDVLSYVKASVNEDSVSDFLRAIQVPTRGIGKGTIEKIITQKESELPEKTKIKIENFRKMLLDFRKKLLEEKLSEALKHIIKTSGMEDMWNDKKASSGKRSRDEDIDRLENVMELVSLASKYDDLPPPEAVEKFLTDTSLFSDQDSLDDNKKGVKLMTVHASKGLEFEYVFISGLEDGLFPHEGFGESTKKNEEGEEERRLFYVALTRARKKLFLSWAHIRTVYGSMEGKYPSEFLSDIPEKYKIYEYANYSNLRMDTNENEVELDYS